MLSRSAVRSLALLIAIGATLGLAACPSAEKDSASGGGDDDGFGSGSSAAEAECVIDSECAPVGATCCACPSFALPVTDPGVDACDGITCPPSTCPQNFAARCVQNRCELACAPLECDEACASGFAADANGCLTCTCAPSDGCALDADCHETGADCCGCALGGSDTAVVDVATYQAGLDCPAAPQCPGGDTCDASAAPRCFAGRCFLLATTDQTEPANACGRPDLDPDPAQPTGTACPGATGSAVAEVCVVNALAAATAQGTGVCLAP